MKTVTVFGVKLIQLIFSLNYNIYLQLLIRRKISRK